MATATTHVTHAGRGDPGQAWANRAHDLATWCDQNLVNRRDAYGQYIEVVKRKDPDSTALTIHGRLTTHVLRRNFLGKSTGHVIGLHSTMQDAEGKHWSRWLAVDIDRHDESVDPETTLKVALAWYARAKSLGFRVLCFDSNGCGGYHLIMVFDGPVPTDQVFAFGRWLTSDWKALGLSEPPETFPKQATLTGKKFGNWLRVAGRHHTRDHFTKVWDGSAWLDGDVAVAYILATEGTPATAIPAEALVPPKAPSPKRDKAARELTNDAQLAKDALQYLDPGCGYDEWLEVGMALTPLGEVGRDLWDGWSEGSKEKYREGYCDRKWRSFTRDGGRTLGTLFHKAKGRGWAGQSRAKQEKQNHYGPKGTAVPIVLNNSAATLNNGDGHSAGIPADEDRKAQAAPDEEKSCSPDMEANPHRLARLFRDQCFLHPDRHRIVYWQGQFHVWKRGAYRAIPAQEMRAELATVIEKEFVRLYAIALNSYTSSLKGGKGDGSGDKSKPPQLHPVTTTLVGNVLQALSGLVLLKLDDYPEMPAWLDDAYPWPAEEVLPTLNAVIHLPSLVRKEGAILPPTPAFFSSYALSYEFDKDAPAPVNWLTFLGKFPVTAESKVKLQLWPDDPQSIDFLQEWFGYHLGQGADLQKALAMIGPKRSGKGTIAFMLGAMIGTENVAGPTLSGLSTQFGLQSLIGKPCAIIDDARLSGKTDVAVLVERLLSITGQGKMNVPRKNQLDWVGTLTSKFTIITNETPRLPDSSEAIASRLMFLHLTESFYGREDHKLKAKLLPELPGILLWAIEGWRRLRERGYFIQPSSGRKLAKEMAELGSPIGAFVRERCVIAPGRKIRADVLYADWRSWCTEKGREHPGDEQGFGRNLRSVMPNLKTTNNHIAPGGPKKRHYEGISLRVHGVDPEPDFADDDE